jgi:hypothetical protein
MITLSIILAIKTGIYISEESGATCRRMYINKVCEKDEMAFETVNISNAT